MKLEDISHRMPYREQPDYVSNLVSATTERALKQQHRNNTEHRALTAASLIRVAAMALILITLGGLAWYYQPQTLEEPAMAEVTVTKSDAPLQAFLSSISDEEAEQIEFYEIEDIPEY